MINDTHLSGKPFAGAIGVFEGLVADGTIELFNADCDAREAARDLVLVVYADGNFNVMTAARAAEEATMALDYVTALSLPAVSAAIAEAKKKAFN